MAKWGSEKAKVNNSKSTKYDNKKTQKVAQKVAYIDDFSGVAIYIDTPSVNNASKKKSGGSSGTVKVKDKGTSTGTNKVTTKTQVSVSRSKTMNTSAAANVATTTTATAPAVSTLKSEKIAKSEWPKYSVSVVYHKDLVGVSDVNEKYVSNPDNQDSDVLNIFDLPGHTRAKMRVITYQGTKPTMRSFEFLVGPSQMAESHANAINPIKTGGGFFIMRSGAELGRLQIAGFLLESNIVDERRLFLESYYKQYLVDKVNAFHEYFNESILYIDLMGYEYQCVLQSLELNRSQNTLFTFSYSMTLIVLNQKPLGTISKPSLTDGQTVKSVGKYDYICLGSSVSTLLTT